VSPAPNNAGEPRRDPVEANAVTAAEGPAIPGIADQRPSGVSWKGVLALAMLVVTVAAATVASLAGLARRSTEAPQPKASERPAAATTAPRRIDEPLPPAPLVRPQPSATLPATEPTGLDDRLGAAPATPMSHATQPRPLAPEDAPVMLVTRQPGAPLTDAGARSAVDAGPPTLEDAQRNLAAYQARLQGLVDRLGRGTSPDVPGPADMTSLPAPAASGGAAAHGPLAASTSAARRSAHWLRDPNLTLAQGTTFTCALKTRLITAGSGLATCQVQRNVYGANGKVLLVERGSHLDGEYRMTDIRPGTVRIPIVWTRLRMPNGVIVPIESPAIGPLGEPGADGHVDNRWRERVGAALLLSLIEDSVQLIVDSRSGEATGNTVVLPSTTSGASRLAEKVLDSTINIPPLIHQNQGAIVGIHVSRDVDFSDVYALRSRRE
jgi:type IV secretion system protein VirB10